MVSFLSLVLQQAKQTKTTFAYGTTLMLRRMRCAQQAPQVFYNVNGFVCFDDQVA